MHAVFINTAVLLEHVMSGLAPDDAVLRGLGQVVSQLGAPEPGGIALLGLVLFVVAAVRRRVWFKTPPTRTPATPWRPSQPEPT